MISTFLIYIKQRFNPLLFAGLGIYLILFSIKFNLLNLIFFPLIFVLLFIFRLYDDLRQADYDYAKPNRDYTKVETRNKLNKVLTLFLIFISIASFLYSLILGTILIAFFIFNHVLYFSLLKFKISRYILPLIKYPFLCFLILFYVNDYQFSSENYLLLFCNSLIIFLASIIFENLSDASFTINKFLLLFFHLIVYILLLLLCDHKTVLLFTNLLYTLAMGYIYIIKKHDNYAYLLALLTIKMLLNYFYDI